MTHKPQVSGAIQYCDKIIAARGVYQNEFFRAIENGAMSFEEFKKTQEQFYFAVLFFARPMTALVARIPQPQMRLAILENVVEEHGGFKEDAFHEATFREFLDTLGLDSSNIDEVGLWPEVRAFNSTLMTSCIFDEIEVGVACLGVIEYMFAEISSLIGRALVDRGWSSEETLVHYKLHSSIDKRHAREFFDIIQAKWGEGVSKYNIKQGIEMGVYIFDRLYKDLYLSAMKHKSESSILA